MSLGPTIPYPVLLGDIGGTNARFAILKAPGAAIAPLPRGLTKDFADPVEAIRALSIGWEGPAPRSALLAIATRVDGPIARMTNAPWVVDAEQVGSRLGLEAVWLLNDYVPVAVAVSACPSTNLLRVGPDTPVLPGSHLVLGPGTGLGAAVLIPVEGRLLVQSTEAGHTDLGPVGDDEMAVWPLLERVGGRVTAEAVLSGPGLLRLYRALALLRGSPGSCATPNEVSATGIIGSDEHAVGALRLFARLLGRFAGDLALTFRATGVYIGGGIAPILIKTLAAGDFRAAFEQKPPFVDWLRSVPTFVITDLNPALMGLCAIAADPARYIFAAAGWTRPEASQRPAQ